MTDPFVVRTIERFLDANHPCRCGDVDCPGNYWEALLLAETLGAGGEGRAGDDGAGHPSL